MNPLTWKREHCWAVVMTATLGASQPTFGQDQSERNVQNALENIWHECLLEFAERAAIGTTDHVEVIMEAALQSCRDEESRLLSLLTVGRNRAIPDFAVSEIIFFMREDATRRIAAAVLNARTSK